MQKSGKKILIVVIVIGLLFCLCIAGILAAIGIPALMSGSQTTISTPKTEPNAYNASAEEWSATVINASDLASDLHLKLTDVSLTRIDVVYALLTGDKTAFTKNAGDFSSQLVDLERALQDSRDLNDKRATITKDLKASIQDDTSSLNKSYVDKALETVDKEKAILDEYAAVLALLKDEQGWYDKASAGTTETAMIQAAIDEITAQMTDKVTVIGDLKLKFNPLGPIPTN